MKMAKLYAVTWIIFAAAILTAYVTDTLSPIKLTIFGFFGSALFFMGLIALVPHLMDRHYESKQLIQKVKKK